MFSTIPLPERAAMVLLNPLRRKMPVPFTVTAELALKEFVAPPCKIEPLGTVVAPLYVDVPAAAESVTRPLMSSVPAPVTGPLTVKVEPFKPVPATVHVCAAPSTIGAEIVTLPALLATFKPSEGEVGETVRTPSDEDGVTPGAMFTAVTPFGSLPNKILLTVKLLSKVVLTTPASALALIVLKFTVFAAAGLVCALVVPAAVVAQLVLLPLIPLQLLLVLPRQKISPVAAAAVVTPN